MCCWLCSAACHVQEGGALDIRMPVEKEDNPWNDHGISSVDKQVRATHVCGLGSECAVEYMPWSTCWS